MTIFSSSTNYQLKDYSILQIVAPFQMYHFVTIRILAEPLKALLNENVDCIFVNKFGSTETFLAFDFSGNYSRA